MTAERDGQPYVVNTAGGGVVCVSLRPIPLEKKVLEETWLQNLLDRNPDVLPISSIDERVTPPLFSLGREISTPSGPIDNLFLSQDGYLVVVETKLRRGSGLRYCLIFFLKKLDIKSQVCFWLFMRFPQYNKVLSGTGAGREVRRTKRKAGVPVRTGDPAREV